MTAIAARAISASRRASALYCQTQGSGIGLLLVHGFGACGSIFQPLLPTLARGHQTIVPDLRGHGQSQRLPVAENVGRFAADLIDVLDLIGVQRVFALGHAGGAAIVQQLAHDAPERVRGMVLVCDASCRSAEPAASGIGGRLRRSVAALLGGVEAGSQTEAAGERILQRFDSRACLRGLTLPTLVVAGANDRQAPPCVACAAARYLPRAETAVVPGGHYLPQTHPHALLEAVLPWLARQEAGA